jgi:hypothetical protein
MKAIETIFEKCVKIANKKFDGHMTLYKFTTNWKFCFGTPNDLFNIEENIYTAKTANTAMKKALKSGKY